MDAQPLLKYGEEAGYVLRSGSRPGAHKTFVTRPPPFALRTGADANAQTDLAPSPGKGT